MINEINHNPYEADKLSQKELEDLIDKAATKYYNTGEIILTDIAYDICLDFLKKKFPKSKTCGPLRATRASAPNCAAGPG